MKKLKIQLIISLTIILVLTNIFSIISFASFNIKSANLYSKGNCGQLIKKDGAIVETTFVVYSKDGKEYPAYCLDKLKPGVGEVGGYSVDTNSLVSNIYLWRAIINGYPYKTPAELGCANEKEAFVATKMAVYSVLYDYRIEQFSGIGEAGERTVNAINSIVNAARYGTETKVSSDLTITNDTSKLDTDKINNKYISQTFKVTAKGAMQNYTVKLSGNVPEGTLITDENNNVKSEFSSTEKFKILMPIDLLGEGGNLRISVEAGVKTKPIFYGTSSNPANQDYAITGNMYEDGKGEVSLTYSKNETKIKIFKKDTNTQEVLSGARFDLLDSNKNVLYTNLISDEQGQILLKNLLPGTYYLKETKAPTDYELYEDYIKLEIGFNEELSVIVNNSKGEKPTIEVTKNKVEVKQQTVQAKLPKTGM